MLMKAQLFMFSLLLVVGLAMSVSQESYVTTSNDGLVIETSIVASIDAATVITQPNSTGAFEIVPVTALALPMQRSEATQILALNEDCMCKDQPILVLDNAHYKQPLTESSRYKELIWPT